MEVQNGAEGAGARPKTLQKKPVDPVVGHEPTHKKELGQQKTVDKPTEPTWKAMDTIPQEQSRSSSVDKPTEMNTTSE